MIKFGTDGWRGIISEDYTFNNVRLVSEAIADYVLDRGEAAKGIAVGYDARFLSRQYAQDCAAVLAGKGVTVWLADSILPTPALTWQVKDRQAAGGVMITASHNPSEYNGLKFKASYGGSASPEIIADIEKYVRKLEASGREFPEVSGEYQVELFAPQAEYLEHVRAMLDKEVLSNFRGKIVFDMMHGAGQGYAAELAKGYGLDLVEIRSEYNPSFGGVNPEPIEKNLAALRQAVLEHKPMVALATDGDADRIGAMDADGRFINAHQIFALLIKYFVEKRGWTGGVAQTLTVSELVKRVAAKYGLKLYETSVGFKYIANLMLSEDILIGGEESGGIGIKNYIPERDGILLGYLLIEVVAAYGKTLGQLLDEMMEELGWFFYSRDDLHLDMAQKERLMKALLTDPPLVLDGLTVVSANCSDGCKLYLESGWVMFRASGTEPIVRIYAEANSQEHLTAILGKAVHYAQNA
ncbi:MAG TPA: phosphoglucomutase/phosphomannomutase family protein [Negativicutes bacterium]